MLKRYVVAVFPETDSQFYEYTDSLDEAKNYAKSQAKQGYKAIIFETLYEFDPEASGECAGSHGRGTVNTSIKR